VCCNCCCVCMCWFRPCSLWFVRVRFLSFEWLKNTKTYQTKNKHKPMTKNKEQRTHTFKTTKQKQSTWTRKNKFNLVVAPYFQLSCIRIWFIECVLCSKVLVLVLVLCYFFCGCVRCNSSCSSFFLLVLCFSFVFLNNNQIKDKEQRQNNAKPKNMTKWKQRNQ